MRFATAGAWLLIGSCVASPVRGEEMPGDTKRAAAAIMDAFNTKDLAALEKLIADDYVDHAGASSKSGYLEAIKGFFTAFPDLKATVDDTIVEGDKAVVRFTFEGTHKGDLLGIAATGKHVRWSGIGILRFAKGRLVERWNYSDVLTLLQQLGYAPQPGAGDAR
jgi:steroid delta-isomerase-like uncharacterized protein